MIIIKLIIREGEERGRQGGERGEERENDEG